MHPYQVDQSIQINTIWYFIRAFLDFTCEVHVAKFGEEFRRVGDDADII